MAPTSTNADKQPTKVVLFDEVHEGYWTGDHECACFNPISPLNSGGLATSHEWYDACTYIGLQGLDTAKKYRVTLHVEAEEIP
jgi:hypothetical protein